MMSNGIILKYLKWFYSYWCSIRNKYSFKKLCRNTSNYHKAELQRLSSSDQPIVSVFLATFQSTWKYDSLYNLMLNDSRFTPIVFICPVVNEGHENMIRYMEECYGFFRCKNYRVIKSYNEETKEFIDLREELNPDILFYTNPYKGLIDDRYYIDRFLDKLTVYVSYNFNNGKLFKTFYDLDFHNLLWRYYAETEMHRQYAIKTARNHGRNIVVSGYPGIESFVSHHAEGNAVIDKPKTIIWAPHHTLEKGPYGHTCFLLYYRFMIKMTRRYPNTHFVFKPHPLLKAKLYEIWGKKQTDEYYSLWANMPNTKTNDGDYEDLFLSSDAMIHDSGSFVVEYLFVNKPVMRTVYDVGPSEQFNSFGLMCLEQHYMGYNEQDIEQFILNVINDIDPLKEQRTKFVNDVLMPKGGMPSENIINDIIDSIENQRV